MKKKDHLNAFNFSHQYTVIIALFWNWFSGYLGAYQK